MFALPAADIHVRRAIASHHFAEPAGSSCTFRSLQPYATPMGDMKQSLSFAHFTGFWVSKAGCRRPCRQGRLRPSLRRELFEFAPQVALAHGKALLPRNGSRELKKTFYTLLVPVG
jgi:hypothetical protein